MNTPSKREIYPKAPRKFKRKVKDNRYGTKSKMQCIPQVKPPKNTFKYKTESLGENAVLEIDGNYFDITYKCSKSGMIIECVDNANEMVHCMETCNPMGLIQTEDGALYENFMVDGAKAGFKYGGKAIKLGAKLLGLGKKAPIPTAAKVIPSNIPNVGKISLPTVKSSIPVIKKWPASDPSLPNFLRVNPKHGLSRFNKPNVGDTSKTLRHRPSQMVKPKPRIAPSGKPWTLGKPIVTPKMITGKLPTKRQLHRTYGTTHPSVNRASNAISAATIGGAAAASMTGKGPSSKPTFTPESAVLDIDGYKFDIMVNHNRRGVIIECENNFNNMVQCLEQHNPMGLIQIEDGTLYENLAWDAIKYGTKKLIGTGVKGAVGTAKGAAKIIKKTVMPRVSPADRSINRASNIINGATAGGTVGALATMHKSTTPSSKPTFTPESFTEGFSGIYKKRGN